MVQVCLAMANCTEEMLVIRAQEDDGDAFSELMRRTFNGSLKMARSMLADREEAEDQVQNSYLKAWLHLAQFQRQSKFSTWMFRIVTNQCLMRQRQLRGKTFVYLDDHKDHEQMLQLEVANFDRTPEEAFYLRQMKELMRIEVVGLPPLLRNVLVLRDFRENSTADVADSLGISEVAVKSRLLRARREVQTRLEKLDTKAQQVSAVGIAARAHDTNKSARNNSYSGY